MNCFSGKFGATSSFDYESVAAGKFNMDVRATTASSRQEAFANVEVTIQGTVDPPTFRNKEFQINVPEATPSGTTLSQGLAIEDQDTNTANFLCSLEDITSLDVIDAFKVVNNNGECKLVTQSKLDYSETPQFKFEVRATDQYFRNMYAAADVVVKVIDANNHKPEFEQNSYWVSVPSSTVKGSTVITLKAVDKDDGTNGKFVYQLISSNSGDSDRYVFVFMI